LVIITGQQLNILDFFRYDNRMARPTKDPAERKSYHLRVPLTDAQHRLIRQVARSDDQDMAAWARGILLEAAKRQMGRRKPGGEDYS
jgi:hypothetical protein